jgi:ribosomal protein L37E
MKDIISNCFLCGEKSLHVAGTEEAQVMQCINCGYTTTSKYTGTKETNEDYKKLSKHVQKWSVEKNGKIWIPTVMALPVGVLHPTEVKSEMKWAFSPMVEIPEGEREKFPNPAGGFYDKRVDTENPTIYDTFLNALNFINQKLKESKILDNTQDTNENDKPLKGLK